MDATQSPVSGGWRAVALCAIALSIACAVVAVAIDIETLGEIDRVGGGLGAGWSGAAPGLAMTIPGALLMLRLGRHPIALVLTIFGVLWGVDGAAAAFVNLALLDGFVNPLTNLAFWFYVRLGAVLLLPIQLLLLLFPEGRLATGGWRIVSIVSLALSAVMPLVWLLAPSEALAAGDEARASSLDRFDTAPTLALTPDVWQVLIGAAFPAALVSTILALAVTVSRRRGATAERRSQLRWLIWAGLIFVAMLALSVTVPRPLNDALFTVGLALVCVSVVIAVTKYRLYDIDRLLGWTLVYALLIASVVLVDVALYFALGSIIDDRATMLVALLIVVTAYAPLRDRLFRLASRFVSGGRDDPYSVVSQLATRLEAAGDTQAQVGELARAISGAFASPFVRVELERPDATVISAAVGVAATSTVDLPLVHDGVSIGRIVMQPGRRPPISPRDRMLLSDLVRLAAAAILNAELSRELQLIREGLVAAREEERSRLRRELHDGLGPLLGGIRLRLETSRNLIESQPARSLEVLDTAIDESKEVVDEIRRLVHELRPPALDDLGLVRALEQQAERLSGADLRIRVVAPHVEPLPAAVEVAIYRIASEALTNVTKHANATTAEVRIARTPSSITVEIEDNGIGVGETPVAGVGLVSLRERATELGGAVRIAALADGRSGTLVSAQIPIAAHRKENADA